ncbi:TonB-dependent receptor plug domain protein [Prevotella sp. BV3P1]|uniref:TonB-dependent receptor n=1 Tax=Prevotellaceae TaxID=171552 RepID=UPI0003B8E112|nr:MULTISPECIES: TonB-dependent receptor [Prevotellaceae]ERT58558.1 TonB-dependent receptor plug domain protein [Prevotella sp. BV3P1]KGF41919.1 TonB-dependent receptor [Hoylesella buccalis DNF00985]
MLRNIQRTQKNGQMRYTLLKGCMALLPLLSLVAAPAIAHDNMEKVADKSENGNLTLRITDAVTGDPIPGAVVKADDAKIYVTDASGNCVMTVKDQTKKIKITVTSVGYKNYTANISPRAGIIPVKLKEDAQMLGGVTVTSKKRHTDIMQQAKTLDQSILEKGGATSLAKMLESIPGVSSISAGSTVAKPVIQGMHSSRILLMNNGVKLESQSWGNDHAPEIDYTGASMVEVVKGAECIRYGFGAMGGVVLLNDAPLPYGHNKPIVKGVTNIGYDTNARGISGSGSIEAGWKNFGMRLHGNYTRGGDYHTPEYIMNNTGYNNISMSAMGGFENKRITATVLTSLFYQRSGIYFGSQISDLTQLQERFRIGRPTESSLQPFSYEIGIPFQQSQHFTLKGEVKYRINPKQSLDLTLSFQENLRQEYENRMKKEWSVIPMQDLILKTYKGDLSYRASWKPYKMSTFAGIANTYQINYNFPGTKNPAFVPNFAALTMGGFLLQKATFFEKLQCELGLRYDFRVMSVSGYTTLNKYDYYDDFKVYSNFTSSFATHYQFNDNWDMRANIGWSWRPPDINELYAIGLQEGSYWVVGNRNLKSERGWKSILGARYRNTWVSIEPSMFYQHINSYIYDHIGYGVDRFHNSPSGKYAKFMYDQDDVRLYGGDIEATVKPVKGLSVVAKGEWIFARNLTRNDWLPFMPSDKYGLSANYDMAFGNQKKTLASFSLSGNYVTKQTRFDPNKDLVPVSPDPYFLLGASADVTFKLPGNREIKLMLVGDNILNTLYKEYTDRFRYYAHERGMNYSLRTIIKF